MDLVVIRTLFILVLTAACYFLRPFALEPWAAAVIGAIAAAAVIVFELRVRALSIKRLWVRCWAACWESRGLRCSAWC